MKVVILGAGVQGACAALALQKTACSITLVDKGFDCMQFSSRVGEGKIHLGHVYAKDNSFRTARRLMQSALCFAPLLEDWLGAPIQWAEMKSNPFSYVVAKDTMVPTAELIRHYERLSDEYRSHISDRGLHYLGERPRAMWAKTCLPSELSTSFADAVVSTPEVSINATKLQRLISATISANAAITTLYGHHVASVARSARGFRVAGTADGTAWECTADVVVNCLWDGRLTIDEQLGVVPDRNWLYRLKYRLLVDLPETLRHLPSFTFVLGPYGDIVTYPDTGVAYLSWYPHCMHDTSAEIAPPSSWQQHIDGSASKTASDIGQKTLQAFDAIIPGIRHSRVRAINAGVIFAWGETDIDDANSELHARHDIGIHEHDGYFSINTGKFTSAPLFAQQLADMLEGQ